MGCLRSWDDGRWILFLILLCLSLLRFVFGTLYLPEIRPRAATTMRALDDVGGVVFGAGEQEKGRLKRRLQAVLYSLDDLCSLSSLCFGSGSMQPSESQQLSRRKNVDDGNSGF